MRFKSFAVVLCFAAVDITYGGSFYLPDCLNAGSTTVIRPSSPCAQIYNQLNSQVQPNERQAGLYQHKSQIIDGREQLQRMASIENSQNNQFQNLNGVSQVYEGKGDERGRFRREIPYQVPYRVNEYDNNYYNPYQGSKMIQMLAELYSQRLGLQQNAYQQAGFNQFVAPQYSQQTLYPFQYNANNQPSYWLNGYGSQPGQNFQNPSMPVSGGLQTTNQNMYGDAYSSISPYNQMGGFTRYPNYPQSGYSNPMGRCTSAACGVVPVCAINCQSSVTPEAQQSQWMDYGQLKQFLAEYANMLSTAQQASGRSLGKSDVVTQATK
uniref:Dihydroorotate dehydrogenase B (NAD(+)), catalytic subunit n=1 Tax=Lygus hesperus TaxID=30085 RepID=A0A0A9XUS6_LYGHE